jgi:membrane associated rhomboid family serine protease
MLFPIGDDNRDRRLFPFINYLLVGLNVFVFFYFQGCGLNQKFTYSYSAVPAEIVSGKDIVTEDKVFEDPLSGAQYAIPGLQKTPVPVWLTIFTSMFMHGGIAHIFGNMMFLLIFGDNIENRTGHFRYLIFYLLCGFIAAMAHIYTTIAFNGDPLIPTLGASGAISGVMGGYILLFPRRRVRVIVFYFLTEVPAIIALGLWFAFQVVNGVGALGSGSQAGGVAYAAHIGGFIAGLFLIKLFDRGKRWNYAVL